MRKFSKLFISFTCIISLAQAAPNFSQYRSFISSSEGVKNSVYVDTMGNKTIGLGHNLGKNYSGKLFYSNNEINSLFVNDLRIAIKDAKSIFPSFNSQPDQIQLILVSLSYNMGRNKLNKFIKFRAAIESKNYKLAALELKDSKWFLQVKGRGVKYVGILNRI